LLFLNLTFQQINKYSTGWKINTTKNLFSALIPRKQIPIAYQGTGMVQAALCAVEPPAHRMPRARKNSYILLPISMVHCCKDLQI
jgi:hypothetical protein